MITAKPLANEFPEVGAWRARLADGSLSDAFAQSYGLLARHGADVRRAYQLDDSGRVLDCSWRTLSRIAAADERADGLAAFVDSLAEMAGACRSSFAGKGLAEGETAQESVIAGALDKLALAFHDRDRNAAGVQLSDIVAQSYALGRMRAGSEAGKRRWRDACEKSEADANRLALELEAEREERATAFRSRDALLEAHNQDMAMERAGRARERDRANAAEAELSRADSRLRVACDQRDKAERTLAEYRTVCAALPFGMARAYPAAHSLMRVYLADVESAA